MKKTKVPRLLPLIGRHKKSSKTMRLVSLFFLMSLHSLFAKESYTQTVHFNLELNNASLEEVFNALRKQSELEFFYNNDQVNTTKRVTVKMKNVALSEVLSQVLSHEYEYQVEGRYVLIHRKKSRAGEAGIVQQAKNEVAGRVFDVNGEPLVGVSVMLEGTSVGTITDIDGRYSIGESGPNARLRFSYVGYNTQEIVVANRKIIHVTMIETPQSLDEIVVIGYGAVKKSDLTGSVSIVKVEDIKDIPVPRVDQMLQGRIAGAEIISTSGEPGANTSIRIRGTRSISATNEPLYVVDGMLDAITDLNELNPSDIESIEVLKDASSTAIYGSRGSNGVIIITTKSGATDNRNRASFRTDVGFSQIPRYLDLMNAAEFAQLQNDRYYIENMNNRPKPLEEYPFPDPLSLGEGTNWTEEITRTAPYVNSVLSLSGGNTSTKYYFSANYNNTEGIVMNSGMKRYQTRLNLDKKVSKYVSAGVKLNYTYIDQDANKAEIGSNTYWYRSTMFLAPTIPVYKEDGSFSDFNPQYYEGRPFDSPLANVLLLKRDRKRKTFNLMTYLEVEPIKELKFRSYISFYDYNQFTDNYTPGEMPTRKSVGRGGAAGKTAYENNNILNENTLSYKKIWNKTHHLSALYGFTFQRFWNNYLSESGDGYYFDEIATNDMGFVPSKETISLSSYRQKQVRISNLMRLDYNYAGKYYLTLTGRADASSNFSENHKWGYFPSAALKWNAAKEAFMKGQEVVNELSVRLSGGTSGNEAIPRYQSLGAMASSSTGYIFDGVIPVSYYPSRIPNDYLTWEKTTSYNVGLDISFLRNRFRITTDAYLSNTKDLLLSVQLPTQGGFPSRLENIGETSNKGVELSLESKNMTTKRFSWSTTLTLAHNKQMVEDIGNNDRVVAFQAPHGSMNYPMYAYKKGRPLNALWGMEYAGTWKSQAEIDQNAIDKKYASASAAYYSPGRQRYIDQNNDGVLNNDDLVYLGNADPTLYGGLQNTFSVYGVNVGVYFNYSYGGKIYNVTELFMGSGTYLSNQYKYMVNAWHPERNPDSDYPRANSKDDVPNDRFVHDASFIRLKNISVSYTFDVRKPTRNAIQSLSLSASGNNLYLWKYYNGYDPEVSSQSEDATIRRMDYGAYPSSRTFSVGIQLNF